MDDTGKTMIVNLEKNTGKSLDAWIKLVHHSEIEKHGMIIKFLQSEYNLTYGFANLIAHKSRASDAGSAKNVQDLVTSQYTGKEHFIPLYEQLLQSIKMFGDDVHVVPKKIYVSLKRKKQFACLKPATKSRFEIGLNLKGDLPKGILKNSKNAMFTHVINVEKGEQDVSEIISFLREAYNRAN